MNSVNSITRAFGLIAIYHCEFLSESSQKPDLTKHFSLRIVFLWDLVQGNAVNGRREPVLLQGTEGSVSVPNAAPLRARRPPHLLPVGYTSSPHCSFIPWSEDSSWAVDLLLCTSIIDYVNVLNSSQTGLKWRHSDFFPFSLLCCLCKCNQLYWGLGTAFISYVSGQKCLLFSVSVFFIYKHRMGNVPGYLGGFGLICRNSQHGCLPRAHLNLESFSFPMLPPPSFTLLEGSSSGGRSPCLRCSFHGHHLLLWQWNVRVKRMYGFSFRFAVCVWAYLLACITVDWHSHPQ